MRYFSFIEYNGSNYGGFQKQKNKNSIQEEVEKALKKLLKLDIKIYLGSRTDSGVHAYRNCFHFNIDFIIDKESIKKGLNKILPADISILEIKQVKEDANARFSAKIRKYSYILLKTKSSFNIGYTYNKFDLLDIDKMNNVANSLQGDKSYKTFSKPNKNEIHDYKCIVYKASFIKKKDKIIFKIESNRFTHNMIRCLLFNILQVGINKMSIEDFLSNMDKKNKKYKYGILPACGLVLVDVKYDKNIFIK